MTEQALLLVNLGSPASTEVADVRRYLNQFLMDPYVVDLPWPLRRLLVSLILIKRPEQLAHAYASIWWPEGSPLVVLSRRLQEAVRPHWTQGPVELAMRYGEPSIESTLKRLAAQGITTFKLQDSYTIITKLAKLPTPGPDDKPHDVLPQAWIYGDVPNEGVLPATVSYPYGCGRILFSTYHTEGKKSTGSTLLPQERALLYVVLEMAVCLKDPLVR